MLPAACAGHGAAAHALAKCTLSSTPMVLHLRCRRPCFSCSISGLTSSNGAADGGLLMSYIQSQVGLRHRARPAAFVRPPHGGSAVQEGEGHVAHVWPTSRQSARNDPTRPACPKLARTVPRPWAAPLCLQLSSGALRDATPRSPGPGIDARWHIPFGQLKVHELVGQGSFGQARGGAPGVVFTSPAPAEQWRRPSGCCNWLRSCWQMWCAPQSCCSALALRVNGPIAAPSAPAAGGPGPGGAQAFFFRGIGG